MINMYGENLSVAGNFAAERAELVNSVQLI